MAAQQARLLDEHACSVMHVLTTLPMWYTFTTPVRMLRPLPCPSAADVTEGVTAHFVDQYEQVYDLAFNYDEEQVDSATF